MKRFVYGVIFIAISALSAPLSQFRVIKEWNYINYTWLNYEAYLHSLTQGYYIPQNNLIAGISYYDGFYYLAVPRMKSGIPVTLARINSANPRSAPLLEPFPSWELNEHGNCTALQNVQNVAVDSEGRMWIIDGGKTGTLNETPNLTCSPKIVIFHIEEMRTLLTYTFPDDVANKSVSFLYDLVVDDSDGGYAYITDNSRLDPGLIIFSVKQNTSWKVREPNTMRADLSAVNFRINNEAIRTPINIAGIALSPKTNIEDKNVTLNEDREVFYCPISSLHLYSISTSYLKDPGYLKSDFSQYVRDIGVKAAQTDGMKMDSSGILYYGLLSTASIARWDSSTPFTSGQQIISKDENYIQWPNSFAFDDEGNILVLTNSLEKYIQNKMSLKEPNFRILMAYVGGKSYVYDDDTLVYSIYETDNQNITTPSSTTHPTMLTTLKKHETTTEIQENKILSKASTTQTEPTVTHKSISYNTDRIENRTQHSNGTVMAPSSEVSLTITIYLLPCTCFFYIFLN